MTIEKENEKQMRKRPEIAQWGDVGGRGGGGEKKRRGRRERESGGEEKKKKGATTGGGGEQKKRVPIWSRPPMTHHHQLARKKITRKFRKIRSAAVNSARRVFGSSGSGRPGSTRSG